MKSGQVNFCPGELFLKLLARIGEWHQNLSEKTVGASQVFCKTKGLGPDLISRTKSERPPDLLVIQFSVSIFENQSPEEFLCYIYADSS